MIQVKLPVSISCDHCRLSIVVEIEIKSPKEDIFELITERMISLGWVIKRNFMYPGEEFHLCPACAKESK